MKLPGVKESLVWIALLLAGIPVGADERPNVLLIAIDDLNGWIGALGGHPQVQTPNIDALAERGVLFSNAHCAAPACNPSRTAVMTGMAPTSSGVYLNQQDWRQSTRLEGIVTLPGHFRDHGYRVLGGGKLYHAATLSPRHYVGLIDPKPWHEYFPSKERQLVEEVLPEAVPLHGTKDFYKGFFDWAALDIEDAEMGDAKVVEWAGRELSRKHEEPLFLAVGIYRPHIPFYTPARYFDLYPEDELVMPHVMENDLDDVPEAGREMARRHWHQWIVDHKQWRSYVRAYLASVSFADAMVGRLIKALDTGPLSDNTVIVLWSDHGYHLGHKEHWEKFALWEQGSRVPLLFVAPGIGGGAVCEQPVSLLDIYPTLAELTGTDSQPQWDGESLGPALRNPASASDRSVVITQGRGNHAVRSTGWRYIRYADGSDELYNHQDDPGEFTNLAGRPEFRAVVDRHAAILPKFEAPMDPELKPKAPEKSH